MVKLLLTNGADAHAGYVVLMFVMMKVMMREHDDRNDVALRWAAENDHLEVVKLLEQSMLC